MVRNSGLGVEGPRYTLVITDRNVIRKISRGLVLPGKAGDSITLRSGLAIILYLEIIRAAGQENVFTNNDTI